jgi:uncharacterized protein (TIGR03086 family)
MTTTTSPRIASPTDPRPPFAAATGLLLTTVAVVRPEQLTAPTPCTEFDVRTLLGHVLYVLRRIAVAGAGGEVGSVPPVTGEPAEGWEAALRAAAGRVAEVWADDDVLDLVMRLPFGTLPGRAALATWIGEVTTHTWDLAVATGQSPAWDDDVAAAGLAAIHGKLPAAGRPAGVPFADAVPVPDDAPVIDRLVAWQGRDPQWRPTV